MCRHRLPGHRKTADQQGPAGLGRYRGRDRARDERASGSGCAASGARHSNRSQSPGRFSSGSACAAGSGATERAAGRIDQRGRICTAHASPSVRQFARELGVDLARVKGSGHKGRITQEDVKASSSRCCRWRCRGRRGRRITARASG